jgi:hypothetical protein
MVSNSFWALAKSWKVALSLSHEMLVDEYLVDLVHHPQETS